MKKKDTRKQELMAFVNQFYQDNFRTPSVREIEAHTSISKSRAAVYLAELHQDGQIDYDGKTIVTDRIVDEISGFNRACMIGYVPCGRMMMEKEDVEKYVNLPISIFGSGEMYILHAYGDSMVDAGIDEGDLIVVRRTEIAHDGDLVVAYVEGEGSTVKRLFTRPEEGVVILHPENDAYEDIVVQDCKIQGTVEFIIKKVH